MFETLKPNYYFVAGLFVGGLDFDREVREGWALSRRASFAPVLDDSSLTLDGWYVQTGYFLTGETRNYRAFIC